MQDDTYPPRSNLLRNKVMIALARTSMSAEEIAEETGESVRAIRTRLTGLKKLNKIYATKVRKKTPSGREVIVWARYEEIV